MGRLTGKVAIVTGSSSGIGKAIALRFGAEGAKVVVTARRLALCEQTMEQIKAKGGEARAIQTDVADEQQVERLIAETVKRYGRLDVLVNNAGSVAGGRRLAETSTKDFDAVMSVNLRGTFFVAGRITDEAAGRGHHHQHVERGRRVATAGTAPAPHGSQPRPNRWPMKDAHKHQGSCHSSGRWLMSL
jgi:NAD(P)-dependent dehydrogenase (short-subunit alcohol dehydrogenase family)